MTTETDDQLARRLLGKVLDGEEPWTPDMRIRIATVAQAYASLAVVKQLRRLNDGRDAFHREVLEVLTQAKDPDGSLRSGQPAAASGCRVRGRSEACDYPQEGLNREQWNRHHDSLYDESRSFNADDRSAMAYADREMTARFGPCPEDSP